MDLRITKLTRHADGHYTANASIDGVTREFTNEQGSWLTMRKRNDDWPERVIAREAPRSIAFTLAGKVKTAERKVNV